MVRESARRLTATLFGAALSVPLLAAPAPAESGPEMKIVGRWVYDVPADSDPLLGVTPGALILNPEYRAAFQLFPLTGGRTLIRVLDLDTMAVRAEATNDLTIAMSRGSRGYVHALDPETNTLYLPYNNAVEAPTGHSAGTAFGGLAVVSGLTGRVVQRFERTTANDPSRAVRVAENPDGPEDAALCTSNACLPQTFGGSPTSVAMEFVPSFVSGGKPKLLMLWTEGTAPGTEGNFYVSWATQWDAATGQQDFSYRIQACTVRFPSGPSSLYPLTIFQARVGGGIYLGCNAQGGTGQVVRIRLDGNGQPSGGGEDSYPGPLAVADVLGDRGTDRLLFRVVTGEGESYWVFNGTTSNYTGVVAATLGDIATRSVVDERNGRLYIMAPGTFRGHQRQGSALLTTDFRRSPAPQVTMHPGVFVENVDLQLAVDTHHASGAPRLFVHPSETNYFVIIEDRVPPSADEPLTDVDRFTVDVKEQEGVTDANFTGTGHAYGFRTLLAGGVLGAVPIGFDASGVTLKMLVGTAGSPCQSQDRELRLGSVPFATLANNLTSAESAAASTEPATIADLREPSARCHPAPNAATVPRVMPEDDDQDGQSNLDESLGSDWPFFSAYCSGEGEDQKVTTLRPLDRRPVPEAAPSDVPKTGTPADGVLAAPRQTPVRLEDNRATARCSQASSVVDASAQASALNVEGLPPNINTLEVGSVGGFSRLWRDPVAGLVAESVAYTRDIDIGGRITIDVAYSRALAWAGGRPGTAGTSLERRVCGVAVPELGGRYDVVPIDTPAGEFPADPDPVPIGESFSDATKDVPNTDGGTGHQSPIDNIDPYNDSSEDQNLDPAVTACADAPTQASALSGTPLGTRPFLEILNRALGARGRASIPDPDSELRQGSPGGYLASIQKDRLQQIGARTVSNDASTQVPAFEIQLYNDAPQGRGRQLLQFAGVDASVTYGIYLLNPDFSTPIDDPDDDLPPFDITDDLIPYTGGPDLPPLYDPPPTPRTTGPVTLVYRGISFLARSWQDAALAAGVLILLIGPLVLLGRRRALRSLA